jgi:hypothetical protein
MKAFEKGEYFRMGAIGQWISKRWHLNSLAVRLAHDNSVT